MRLRARFSRGVLLFSITTLGCSYSALAQNPPASHVVIPNPTPRPPDIKQEYGTDTLAPKSQQALLIKSQLRAREVWLEANQILFIAQQLHEEVLQDKTSASMNAKAAKAGEIEKLAKTMQEKMKVQ